MTALQKVENQNQLTEETVKKVFCPLATDQEILMFLGVCRSHNLDPWRREAYLIKYSSSQAAQIVVGKDTFTRRAQMNPKFKGFNAGVIVERKDQVMEVEGAFTLPTDKIVGGWAHVHVDGYATAIKAYVSMREFGKQQSTWKSMPATMIRKVALVGALREAFPEELGGLYDSSEMGADVDRVQKTEDKPVELKKIERLQTHDVQDAEMLTIDEDKTQEEAKNTQSVKDESKKNRGTNESRCRKAFEVLKIAQNHQKRLIKCFEGDWELLLNELNQLASNLKGATEIESITIMAKFLEMFAGEK